MSRNKLVYLPANVWLYQFGEEPREDKSWSVTRFHELKKPINVLLLNKDGHRYFQVLYNAEKWFVKATDVYEVRS